MTPKLGKNLVASCLLSALIVAASGFHDAQALVQASIRSAPLAAGISNGAFAGVNAGLSAAVPMPSLTDAVLGLAPTPSMAPQVLLANPVFNIVVNQERIASNAAQARAMNQVYDNGNTPVATAPEPSLPTAVYSSPERLSQPERGASASQNSTRSSSIPEADPASGSDKRGEQKKTPIITWRFVAALPIIFAMGLGLGNGLTGNMSPWVAIGGLFTLCVGLSIVNIRRALKNNHR